MRKYRVGKVCRKLRISIDDLVVALGDQGYQIENNPDSYITDTHIDYLCNLFISHHDIKEENLVIAYDNIDFSSNFPFQFVVDYDTLFEDNLTRHELAHYHLENDQGGDPIITLDQWNRILESVKNKKAFITRILKRIIRNKRFKLKKRALNIKHLLESIISPKTYYIFTKEDEDSRVAKTLAASLF